MNDTGEKTLECYSKPLDLRRFGTDWVTAEKDVWNIADALSILPHYNLVPKGNRRHVRKAGTLIEWPKSNPRA